MLLMSDTKTCPKCGGELDHDDDDHYYTCRDCYEDWSEYNLLDCLAAKTAECEQAQAACAAYVDIPAIVREICEHREVEPCWLDTDGDCGNWKECSPDCPLAKLRKLAGYTYQNDNGDLGPATAKPNPGQPLLDANAKLRTQNADLMAALQNLCLEIRDYNPTGIDLGPAVAAIAQGEGGKQ